MTCRTPLFPGWSRQLCGRRPVHPAGSLRRKAATVSGLCMAQAQELFGNLLSERTHANQWHWPCQPIESDETGTASRR